jgi:hypothetical protein
VIRQQAEKQNHQKAELRILGVIQRRSTTVRVEVTEIFSRKLSGTTAPVRRNSGHWLPNVVYGVSEIMEQANSFACVRN